MTKIMKNFKQFTLNEGVEDVKKMLKVKKDNITFKKLTDNSDKLLKRIISLDPTSNLVKDVAGKYSKWLLNLYYKSDEELLKILKVKNLEDDYKITDMLNTYDKNKKIIDKKNIFDYKSLDELGKSLSKFNVNDDLNVGLGADIQKDVKNGNIEFFGKFKNYTIIIPNNKEMACKYGVNTKWCTAKREHNAFDSYSGDGRKLYILLDNKEMKPSYQFHFETNQFMDVDDKRINLKDFYEENIDIFDKFYPEVKTKLSKQENLTTDEFKFLPKTYINEYLKYVKNEFIDILKSKDLDKLEENKDTYIGFENYNVEVNSDSISIQNFGWEKIQEIFEIDNMNYVMNMDVEYHFRDSEEKKYFFNNLIDDDIKLKLDRLFKLTGTKKETLKHSDFDEYYDTFFEIMEFQDDRKIESIYHDSLNYRQKEWDEKVKKELAKLPFDIEEGGWRRYDYLYFYYEKVINYIINNNLLDVMSFEQLLNKRYINLDFFDYEDIYDEIYNLDDNSRELRKEFSDYIDEIIENIEDYGENGDYAHLIQSEEYINALKILDNFGLEIGKTSRNKDKSIEIIDIDKNGKITINYSNKTIKNKKMKVDAKDVKSYLYQEQLPFESKIYNFNKFINEKFNKNI